MSLGGELVLVSACLTVTPPITGGQEHTQGTLPIFLINTLLLYIPLLALQYILKNNETFSNLSVMIVSQKYQEFSIQVENRE